MAESRLKKTGNITYRPASVEVECHYCGHLMMEEESALGISLTCRSNSCSVKFQGRIYSKNASNMQPVMPE